MKLPCRHSRAISARCLFFSEKDTSRVCMAATVRVRSPSPRYAAGTVSEKKNQSDIDHQWPLAREEDLAYAIIAVRRQALILVR